MFGFLKGNSNKDEPEIVFSDQIEWSTAQCIPAQSQLGIFSEGQSKIKIPQSCWTKTKGASITDNGKLVCRIMSSGIKPRVLHFLSATTEHKGFLLIFRGDGSSVYRIYTCHPNVSGQAPEKGLVGLHKVPVYLWANYYPDGRYTLVAGDNDDDAGVTKACCTAAIDAKGDITITKMNNDIDVVAGRALLRKSNMVPVSFLHCPAGSSVDKLAMIALSVCASDQFLSANTK